MKLQTRRGFTLIEFVVVLVIMGVVLTVATPAFTVRGGNTRDESVERIVSLLRKARGTSLETARQTTVTIDPATSRIWVRNSGAAVPLDTSFVISLPIDAQLSSLAPRVEFTFDARGLASGGELIVTSPRGRSAITVDGANGDVRVATIGASGGNGAR